MIRILVVDDHELVRKTLCSLLDAQPDFEVVSEATNGREAIRKAQEFKPDVVLLDIGLPELNGLHAAPLIKRASPQSEILIVTQYEEQFFARQALAAGARGFLTKAGVAAELVSAVRTVHDREEFVGKRVGPAATKLAPAPSVSTK